MGRERVSSSPLKEWWTGSTGKGLGWHEWKVTTHNQKMRLQQGHLQNVCMSKEEATRHLYEEATQTCFQKSACWSACLKSSYAKGYSVASHSAWWINMRNRDLCALAGQLPCWDDSDVLGQQTCSNGETQTIWSYSLGLFAEIKMSLGNNLEWSSQKLPCWDGIL